MTRQMLTSRQWIKASSQNDLDDLINTIKSIHNCREVEIGDDGRVWIADPQRGHWLNDADLADLVHDLLGTPRAQRVRTYHICKNGISLWHGQYASKEEAVAAYVKDLGAEAFDYDAVNPNWQDELEVEA
jgi:hypothetical protein